VDGGESPRLTNLIRADEDLLTINQQLPSGETITHRLCVMQWDSVTQNITYTGTGAISSISKLCSSLEKTFY
jgi:VCBS repeat-containing protein